MNTPTHTMSGVDYPPALIPRKLGGQTRPPTCADSVLQPFGRHPDPTRAFGAPHRGEVTAPVHRLSLWPPHALWRSLGRRMASPCPQTWPGSFAHRPPGGYAGRTRAPQLGHTAALIHGLFAPSYALGT